MRKRRIVGILSAIGLGIGSLTVATTPAFACCQGPSGFLTLWDGNNGGSNPTAGFGGAAWALNTGGGIGVCHALPSGANDRPSAFSNNTTHNFRVWTAAGCTGSSATLFAGTETGELDSPFNNSISSQQRIS